MVFVVFALLIICIILLVFLGYRAFSFRFKSRQPKQLSLSKEYLTGLNFLLNEQPDKAVDLFVELLDVDSDTVETHLALGKLFRKRGEIDRAIRIHQNLIERSELEATERVLALQALGYDYLSAGVLDRSEQAFKEVLLLEPGNIEAHNSLLDIYQQEKEWGLAIEVATKLATISKQPTHRIVAHCYCEIAERRLAQSEIDACTFALSKAFGADKRSARAHLLKAQVAILHFDYKLAIKSLKRTIDYHPMCLFDSLSLLMLCYGRLNDRTSLVGLLQACLEKTPNITIHALCAMGLIGSDDIADIMPDLTAYAQKCPSIQGVYACAKSLLADDLSNQSHLSLIADQLEFTMKNNPIYRCSGCGFSGQERHWLCPSCREWETIQPIISGVGH